MNIVFFLLSLIWMLKHTNLWLVLKCWRRKRERGSEKFEIFKVYIISSVQFMTLQCAHESSNKEAVRRIQGLLHYKFKNCKLFNCFILTRSIRSKYFMFQAPIWQHHQRNCLFQPFPCSQRYEHTQCAMNGCTNTHKTF